MKRLDIMNGPQDASAIVLGCMRMPALSVEDAAGIIRTAAENGINFYDHATCYGNGEAETRFGEAGLEMSRISRPCPRPKSGPSAPSFSGSGGNSRRSA